MPHRLLNRIVQFREGEATTAWLMFAFSFLAMTAHNIIKPLTRSKFIKDLGADNLPYVMLVAGVIIAVLMAGHAWASARLPRKAVIPATLGALIVVLGAFRLLFSFGWEWVPAAFFLFGLIFGLLLISQFWTLANDVYDPRQARRVFGFIGGGASLGGVTGNSITYLTADLVSANNLLLVCAAVLGLCVVIVSRVVGKLPAEKLSLLAEEKGVGVREALDLLRRSRHLQIIALVIASAAVSAQLVEQQMNMAAEASKGSSEVDLQKFFSMVGIYLSIASFVIQVGLTSVIHKSLGLTFALMLLPLTLGGAAGVILVTGALWAPTAARVIDTALRYSLDKTTREVLFLPLPPDLKHRAKPFVDVTLDRNGKAVGALLSLVMIKPWGLGWSWQLMSLGGLLIVGLWVVTALIARREYLQSFRKSLDARQIRGEAVRVNVADPATIEALVEELAHPDEAAVLYAIDMLESLDKRHLVTPLLLHHASPRVRARALDALQAARRAHAEHWVPAVERMLKDEDAGVRAAAVRALAALTREDASAFLRRHLDDADPRVLMTVAVELADSGRPADARAAEEAVVRLSADTRASSAVGRREAAAALAHIRNPAFRSLLIPLIHDRDITVAREAVASARAIGPSDAIFVPALVSLLGHRYLKGAARETLVSYGDDAVAVLGHLLRDRDEQPWVRRHIPGTLARMPSQAALAALEAVLDDPDGFLRFKTVEAIASIRRARPELAFASDAVEKLVTRETGRYYTYLTLRANLLQAPHGDTLLVRALDDKLGRTLDRIYRQLGLIHPWQDVVRARQAIETGDVHARASAIEFMDTLLSGAIRKRVMPIIDEMPMADRVRHANSVLKSRPRDVTETLTQLIHDDDPVVSASAIGLVGAQQLSALDADLEFVQSRGTAPRLVRDAAAWALGARDEAAAGDGRAWPVVAIADRLRQIPVFSFVSVDELFRMAGSARQVRVERGRPIGAPGAPVTEVFFLVDGSVLVDGAPPDGRVTAPAALAFEDMLNDSPQRHAITAADTVTGLTLSVSEFLTMLSDNIAMAQGLFRMLLASRGAVSLDQVAHPAPDVRPSPSLPLDPVEKALVLRQNPLLGGASVEQLLDLAAIAREVPMARGSVLVAEREAPSTFHILTGQVQLAANGDAPLAMGAGGTIGLAETLSGIAPTRRVTVTEEGWALRLDHDELFEVLSDHLDLLQGVFSGVLKTSPSARPS
jgi:AAA family ATP:ADP antiporter